MRLIALCVACAAVASCRPPATTPSPQLESPDKTVGLFDFTIRNGSTVMTGVLNARGDTMTVEPREGNCFVDRAARNLDEWMIFNCEGVSDIDGLTLSFDRRNPQARSRWHGSILRFVTERQCTAYTIDARGQSICTATQTIQVERRDQISGTVILRWRSPGD